MGDHRRQPASITPSTVLITGAAGGLGAHLVAAMADAGWTVHALDKATAAQTQRQAIIGSHPSIRWWSGPADHAQIRAAMSGCKLVIHAAGLTSLSATEDDLYDANHRLACDVFKIAEACGVEHFVQISCASVYAADTAVRTEAAPTETYTPFEDSKLDAEQSLQEMAQAEDAPALTILRLGLLYGPGCTTMGAGLITLPAILRGVSSLLPGLSGGPRTNWCHVEDAAQAVALVAACPQARGAIYNVADETALSFGEVLTSIIEGYGINLGPSVRMPGLAMWTLLSPVIDYDWAFDRTRDILRLHWRQIQREYNLDSPLTPRLDRDAMFYVRDDAIVVADAIKALGWEPQWTDFRNSIADTIRWYQEHRWAPRFDFETLAQRRDGRPTPRLRYGEQWQGEADDNEAPIAMNLEITWSSVPLPLQRREATLEGQLTLATQATAVPVTGTVSLRWAPQPVLTYEFGFRDDRGQAGRFVGERRLSLQAPLASWHELSGEFVDHCAQTVCTTTLRRRDGLRARLVGAGERRR